MRPTRNPAYKPTLAYYAAFIGLGLISAVLGPTLPALADITETSFGQISILFIARSLGYVLGSMLGGYWLDRASGHPVMIGMLTGVIILLVVTPITPFLWLLAGIIFLTGLARGVVDVGGNTLLVWVHGENVGPFMNALHLFYGVGSFLAPVIIAQALQITGGISWGYWTIALLLIPPIIPLFIAKSPSSLETESGTETKTEKWHIILLMVLFLFCYSSMANIFGGWIYSYSLESNLANETNAAYLTSLFWGAFTVGRLISIPIAARYRPNSILTADLMGCLLSVGLMLLFPRESFAIWAGTAGLGLSVASMFPTVMTLAERCLEVSGRITSRFVIGSALGGMLPPWLVGQLFETTGPKAVILTIFGFLVVQGLVFALLMKKAASDQVVWGQSAPHT